MIGAVIFSNNSPLFLETFLKSVSDNNIKVFNFSVLYKTDELNKDEYLRIFEKYNILNWTIDSNFKENLLGLINAQPNNAIAFFKDTNYFFSELPPGDIESIMEDQDIFCFSFGLGRNTTHCYHNDVYNILLNEEENGDNTIKWNWVKHYLDFGRPLELGAGHTFHKKEIIKFFKKWNYDSIQSLEASFENLDYYPKELMSSFKKSVLVDVISKADNPYDALKIFDFNSLDRIIIEI